MKKIDYVIYTLRRLCNLTIFAITHKAMRWIGMYCNIVCFLILIFMFHGLSKPKMLLIYLEKNSANTLNCMLLNKTRKKNGFNITALVLM